jgi:DNA-binding MarR family transcriptional regulator
MDLEELGGTVIGTPGSWRDFSFVVSSHQREKVFSALGERPKLPRELATETRIRLAHVSRALRELSTRRLVVCLTPELRARGRVYSLTDQGGVVLRKILEPERPKPPPPGVAPSSQEFVPKVRASSVLRILTALRNTRDPKDVAQLLKEWNVPVEELTEDSWLPISACAQLLDLMERSFGDGSFGYIRRTFADSVASFPTVKEQISRGLPLSLLARRAPAVYAKEWNFGRMEVEVDGHRSIMRHIDWAPTPAMCALFHGVYEGILRSRRVEGRVTKTRCVRAGDPYCEYVVEW